MYWKSTTNNTYTSTAYYYLDYTLMARFAGLLGKDAAPYRQKADELKAWSTVSSSIPKRGSMLKEPRRHRRLPLFRNRTGR